MGFGLAISASAQTSVAGPKVRTVPILDLPADLEAPPAVAAMQDACHVDVQSQSRASARSATRRQRERPVEGLLSLPHRYVVPGGRLRAIAGTPP